MFFGSIPALVTPFSGGRVAEDTFREFIDWQIAEGTDGLVPCGTTGECATLTSDEHRHVIATAVEAARGRVPVIAGCGSYSTAHAIEMVRASADVGADAVLVVVPYYNKPSQAGLAAHFLAIAEASPLPIVVYNVPSRTVADISVETLGSIAKAPKDRRYQGRHWEPRACICPAARLRPRFHSAQRQRRHGAGIQRDGWSRLHLRHRQCRAAALLRFPEGDP